MSLLDELAALLSPRPGSPRGSLDGTMPMTGLGPFARHAMAGMVPTDLPGNLGTPRAPELPLNWTPRAPVLSGPGGFQMPTLPGPNITPRTRLPEQTGTTGTELPGAGVSIAGKVNLDLPENVELGEPGGPHEPERDIPAAGGGTIERPPSGDLDAAKQAVADLEYRLEELRTLSDPSNVADPAYASSLQNIQSEHGNLTDHIATLESELEAAQEGLVGAGRQSGLRQFMNANPGFFPDEETAQATLDKWFGRTREMAAKRGDSRFSDLTDWGQLATTEGLENLLSAVVGSSAKEYAEGRRKSDAREHATKELFNPKPKYATTLNLPGSRRVVTPELAERAYGDQAEQARTTGKAKPTAAAAPYFEPELEKSVKKMTGTPIEKANPTAQRIYRENATDRALTEQDKSVRNQQIKKSDKRLADDSVPPVRGDESISDLVSADKVGESRKALEARIAAEQSRMDPYSKELSIQRPHEQDLQAYLDLFNELDSDLEYELEHGAVPDQGEGGSPIADLSRQLSAVLHQLKRRGRDPLADRGEDFGQFYDEPPEQPSGSFMRYYMQNRRG